MFRLKEQKIGIVRYTDKKNGYTIDPYKEKGQDINIDLYSKWYPEGSIVLYTEKEIIGRKNYSIYVIDKLLTKEECLQYGKFSHSYKWNVSGYEFLKIQYKNLQVLKSIVVKDGVYETYADRYKHNDIYIDHRKNKDISKNVRELKVSVYLINNDKEIFEVKDGIYRQSE